MLDTADTIAAIATARDGAVRGIVRVSGPRAIACAAKCFHADTAIELAQLRMATVVSGTVRANAPIGEVPCDVYVWPNESSYTRQPTLEIHTIGAAPVLEAIVT